MTADVNASNFPVPKSQAPPYHPLLLGWRKYHFWPLFGLWAWDLTSLVSYIWTFFFIWDLPSLCENIPHIWKANTKQNKKLPFTPHFLPISASSSWCLNHSLVSTQVPLHAAFISSPLQLTCISCGHAPAKVNNSLQWASKHFSILNSNLIPVKSFYAAEPMTSYIPVFPGLAWLTLPTSPVSPGAPSSPFSSHLAFLHLRVSNAATCRQEITSPQILLKISATPGRAPALG